MASIAMPDLLSSSAGSYGVGGYNPSPMPRSGQGAYGAVPGAIGLPDPAGDLAKVYPNLSAQNNKLSSNIMSELSGELSPDTIRAIQDNAATFGVTSGMPLSQFSGYRGLRNLGLNVENVKGKGLQDYLSAITGISKTQTVSPELQTEIATQNSVWNAAPDPAAASAEQQRLFQKYLEDTSSPAGGTATSGVPWYDQNRAPGSTRHIRPGDPDWVGSFDV